MLGEQTLAQLRRGFSLTALTPWPPPSVKGLGWKEHTYRLAAKRTCNKSTFNIVYLTWNLHMLVRYTPSLPPPPPSLRWSLYVALYFPESDEQIHTAVKGLVGRWPSYGEGWGQLDPPVSAAEPRHARAISSSTRAAMRRYRAMLAVYQEAKASWDRRVCTESPARPAQALTCQINAVAESGPVR